MQNKTKIVGLEIQFTVFVLRINFRRSAKQIAWLRLIYKFYDQELGFFWLNFDLVIQIKS